MLRLRTNADLIIGSGANPVISESLARGKSFDIAAAAEKLRRPTISPNSTPVRPTWAGSWVDKTYILADCGHINSVSGPVCGGQIIVILGAAQNRTSMGSRNTISSSWFAFLAHF